VVISSCPARHSLENIRAYALAKLAWIRESNSANSKPSHANLTANLVGRDPFPLGAKLPLERGNKTDAAPASEADAQKIILHVRPETSEENARNFYEECAERRAENHHCSFDFEMAKGSRRPSVRIFCSKE
jgi:predicted metal-dependent hydrolase